MGLERTVKQILTKKIKKLKTQKLNRNWTGLLVEPNKRDYEKVRMRRRHAYTANACLSHRTEKISFIPDGVLGGIESTLKQQQKIDKRYKKVLKRTKPVTTQCFRFADMMRVIGVTHIDYFSLDVEGGRPSDPLDVGANFLWTSGMCRGRSTLPGTLRRDP